MSAPTTHVAFAWEPLLTDGALLAAGGIAALVLWLAWRSSRGLRVRRRLALLGLRAVALAILGFVLAGPTQVTTTGRLTRDPFVVLIDASRSMRVEDLGARSRASVVGEWLQAHQADFAELSQDVDVRYVLFGDGLQPWSSGDGSGDGPSDERRSPPRDTAASGGGGPGSGAPTPSDQPNTDLGAALFGLPDVLGGGRPAGVLLVSDGADRSALSRAMKAGGVESVEQLVSGVSYPVSTWTVGDMTGARDLAVRAVDAPPFGFVRRPLGLTAHLINRGLEGRTVLATLRSDGEVVDSAQLRVETGDTVEVTFEVKPDAIGYHTYEVAVPVPEGDTIPSNNALEFTVKVVRDRTRILQVTSRPSWDVKFLRRLLKTDPNIDLVSFFILRNREHGRLLNEDLSLIQFPYKELFGQDLQGFDLVIFQNFWFGSFSNIPDRVFLNNLREYVNDGGAFVMVGGDASFGAAAYGRSALAEIMPAEMLEEPTTSHRFTAQLTEAGLRHPVTRLDRELAQNAGRWGSLPPLQGLNPLGPLADGGVALVEDGEGQLVAAVRSVGKGRTMAVATDTTWNWALAGTGGPGAGQDHAIFWRNAVRWLVKDAEQKQVQVLTNQENYRLGDTIHTQVRVLTDDYAPREGVAIEGTAVPVRGGEPRTFTGITDASGQVAVALPAEPEGTLRIHVHVPSIAEPFGDSEARVSVTDREGELEDPAAQPEIMAAIARATGGLLAVGEGPRPQDAPRRPVDALLATDREVDPLWSRSWLLLALVFPLGAEWVLRRRMGLR